MRFSKEKINTSSSRHAGSAILRVVYGYEIQSENDPYVALADEAMKGLTQAVNAGAISPTPRFDAFAKL
jgi:hypothetical protein